MNSNDNNYILSNSLLSIGGIIFEGFVISKLWNWFFAPTFSVATIGIIVGIAISLTVGLLTFTGATNPPKENQRRIWNNIVALSFALLFGYILTLFM